MTMNNKLPEVSITDIDRDARQEIIVGSEKGENRGVLVIYTGGTIGSMPKDPNDVKSPMIVAKWPEFRKAVPVLNNLPFRIDAVSFETPLDSSNIGPQHWIKMAQIIGDPEHYDEYEGFVIIHGTDTMVYTASMLSFMLQNLNKPVIITGSQIPIIEHPRNDALQNLVTALMIANPTYSNIPIVKEVCIFFRDKLLRGNRTRKMDASGYLAFHTPNYPVLGTAGDNIDIEEKFLLRPKGDFNPVFDLNRDVIMLDIFPGFQDRSKIRDLIFDPNIVSAVVLKSYGTGNVPTEKPEVLFLLNEEEIDLVTGTEPEGTRSRVESCQENDQEGSPLKEELKRKFEDNNCALSKAPRIFEVEKNKWEISDRGDVLNDKRYKLELKDGEIHVSPFGFLDDIQMAVKRGQIIINVTQCPYGSVEQGLYDTSAVLTDCGVLSGQEVTPEAALCKLMVILAQAKMNNWKPKDFIPLVNKNIAGEQNFSICSTKLEPGRLLDDKPHFWYRIPSIPLEGNLREREKSNIARAILRFKNALVKKKPKYKFSLNKNIKEELLNGEMEKLFSAFEENNISYSESTKISVLNSKTWKVEDRTYIYHIEDDGIELKVSEAERPLTIEIYIDLVASPTSGQLKMCLAGRFIKQQNELKQSITFDITQVAKERLQQNSSFTIMIKDDDGTFEFDEQGIELSLFLK